MKAIGAWQQLPDFASVNFDEEGCEELARLLIKRGVAVEAGILDTVSTRRFLASRIRAVRVLIELQEQKIEGALRSAERIIQALGNDATPRLLHGHGAPTWELVDEAARRGYDTRIGLEDVSTLPDGRAASNVELYRAALRRTG